MKTIYVWITGNGTKTEIADSLFQLADSIENMPMDFDRKTFEDETLLCELTQEEEK